MFKKKRVSLIFPTYNEMLSMENVLIDAVGCEIFDEIIIVNNNAAPGTSIEINKAKKKTEGSSCRIEEIFEQKQGIGSACFTGLDHASGDILVLCEPDMTFEMRDIHKLLSYIDDFNVVYGSRTISGLIDREANMNMFLKYGNFAVAKLLQLLFKSNYLSDVGCTYRVMNKDVWRDIRSDITEYKNLFISQMMIAVACKQISSVQIPVHYRKRVGISSLTGNKFIAVEIGCQIIALILKRYILNVIRSILLKVRPVDV